MRSQRGQCVATYRHGNSSMSTSWVAHAVAAGKVVCEAHSTNVFPNPNPNANANPDAHSTMHISTALAAISAEPTIGAQFRCRAGNNLDELFSQIFADYWAVERGAASLFITKPALGRHFLKMIGPGAVFAPYNLVPVQSGAVVFTIEAVTDLTIRCFSSREWDRLSLRHVKIQESLAMHSCELLNVVHHQMLLHYKRDSLERTRFALWSYATTMGTPSACGGFTIKIGRTELARCVGISGDRITRLVRRLHQGNEIKIVGRSIIVGSPLMRSYDGQEQQKARPAPSARHAAGLHLC